MSSSEIKSLVTTNEAAKFLGVSTSTIYRMVEQKILNPVKTPGGQRRFNVSELDEYKSKSRDITAPQNPSKLHHTDEQLDLSELFASLDEVAATAVAEPEVTDNEVPTEAKTGVYDQRNQLNDLTGTEWLPETKSFWFQKGLGSKHPHAQIERQHPAPFSFQDISRLIAFFTKEGGNVLDPFSGVGSTVKACALLNRRGTGIELSPHWNELARERLEFEVGPGISDQHSLLTGDSRYVLKTLDDDYFDFMVTSPPYWSILNKKADHKVTRDRVNNNLATNYSDRDDDLANIDDYGVFLDELSLVFSECGRVLKSGKYMSIVVSDFRHKSEFVSFHSDLIQRLNKLEIAPSIRLTLQGVKVLLQNHKSLLPYGYPFAYVENIHHQYILIFKKEVLKKSKKKDLKNE